MSSEYLPGCTDAMARRCRKLARGTGTPHRVIDVATGGGRGHQRVVPQTFDATRLNGVVTELYRADGGELAVDGGFRTEN